MAEFLINSAGLPEWLAWTITAVVAAVLILNVIAGGALVFIWAERKIAARIQDRLGPTRTGGRFGWLQSLADGIKLLAKEDLMPEGEEERLAQMYQAQMAMLYSGAGIAEGSAADTMVQVGTFNTVKELNGKKIRIPGYTVPFEYGADAQIKEFLLVPYFGACIHSPPPPPNQTIFIMADKPIKMNDLAQAVWIEGTIYTQTQESDLADAAYTIKLTSIEEYTY